MEFKDHFSPQAKDYARFRPKYPAELFRFLASLPPARVRAWDCGTGSGQAAVGLAEWFDEVIATDASQKQIDSATPHPRIRYRTAPAEDSGIDTGSIDLTVVAQALHWFDLDRFYAEVRRVSRPGGILAVWTYDLFRIAPGIDAVVHHYYKEVVGPYWPPERKWVEDRYRTIPFPFHEIPAPDFTLEARWTLSDLLGMLGTWSATQACRQTTGADPRETVAASLERAWGQGGTSRRVVWPLNLRLGRVHLTPHPSGYQLR